MKDKTWQEWVDYINEVGIDQKERDFRSMLWALKLALPCVEYAEIATAAEGQSDAHEKCLAALDHIRPLLLTHGVVELSREVQQQTIKKSLQARCQ